MVKRALLVALFVVSGWSVLWGASYTIPAGTVLNCRLTQTLTTQLNYQGQAFTATVSEPLVINGQQAIPIGTTVNGRIASLSRPGRIKGVGQMVLSPETISMPNGRTFTLSAVLIHAYGAPGARVVDSEGLVKGPNAHKGDLTEIGIGTGGGAFFGTLLGGFRGTFIGGLIGGGAALVDRLRRRGPDLALPTGTELKFQLSHQLIVTRSGIAEYNLSSR
ncbi:MAG: TrbI/VirB10 family protein [Acidobacteria bacterium]|nr:TrbI/VirB10 family protein [Acidobacteriota bacterium]